MFARAQSLVFSLNVLVFVNYAIICIAMATGSSSLVHSYPAASVNLFTQPNKLENKLAEGDNSVSMRVKLKPV